MILGEKTSFCFAETMIRVHSFAAVATCSLMETYRQIIPVKMERGILRFPIVHILQALKEEHVSF